MNITSKGRYAMQIMLDLSSAKDGSLKKRSDIAKKHNIPLNYMNKIILGLKTNGLLICYRGAHGGLKLLKPANEISIWDVISAVEEKVVPVSCIDELHTCTIQNTCLAKKVWQNIFADFKATMQNRKLIDF